MTAAEQDGEHDGEAPEFLELGLVGSSSPSADDAGPSPARPGLSRRALVTAALVAGGLGVAATTTRHARPWPTGPQGPPPVVTTRRLARPLTARPGRWALLALGTDVLLRIDATGRLTQTRLPRLPEGEISFVAARGATVIRPLGDGPPGWLVPDGAPPSPLPPELAGIGTVLPGPDPDHVWTQVRHNQRTSMALVAVATRSRQVTVPVPEFATTGPMPDGAGGLLFEGIGGLYALDQSARLRVLNGILLAVGAAGLLTMERDGSRWRTLLRARRGTDRAVAAFIGPQVPHGALSPDGTTVALYVVSRLHTIGLALVDLASGTRRLADVPVTPAPGGDAAVWAPCGRSLLAVDGAGGLRTIDPATGTTSVMAADLPEVRQLAVQRV